MYLWNSIFKTHMNMQKDPRKKSCPFSFFLAVRVHKLEKRGMRDAAFSLKDLTIHGPTQIFSQKKTRNLFSNTHYAYLKRKDEIYCYMSFVCKLSKKQDLLDFSLSMYSGAQITTHTQCISGRGVIWHKKPQL